MKLNLSLGFLVFILNINFILTYEYKLHSIINISSIDDYVDINGRVTDTRVIDLNKNKYLK